MIRDVEFLPEAVNDYKALDRRQQLVVDKAIRKIRDNPLPQSEGGYGKPLGHKLGTNLTGFLKIKLKGEGLRIVYRIIRTKTKILIIVIGVREDADVYLAAQKRLQKYHEMLSGR